jgi:hypothetical protein
VLARRRHPDIAEAVVSPPHLSTDLAQARRVLDLVPRFPAETWVRHELKAGEMCNSNSLTAWLLARSGHQMEAVGPPPPWPRSRMVFWAGRRRMAADICPS